MKCWYILNQTCVTYANKLQCNPLSSGLRMRRCTHLCSLLLAHERLSSVCILHKNLMMLTPHVGNLINLHQTLCSVLSWLLSAAGEKVHREAGEELIPPDWRKKRRLEGLGSIGKGGRAARVLWNTGEEEDQRAGDVACSYQGIYLGARWHSFQLGFSPPQPAGHWLQTGYLPAREHKQRSLAVRMVSHRMLSKAWSATVSSLPCTLSLFPLVVGIMRWL